MCWASKARRRCLPKSLCFQDPADEEAFRRTIEVQVARGSIAGCVIVLISIPVVFLGRYNIERKAQNPFRWGLDDPRTIFFAALLANLLIMGVALTVFLVGKRAPGIHRFLRVETLTLTLSSWYLMANWLQAPWHVAVLGRPDAPETVWANDVRHTDLLSVLVCATIILANCFYIPIRTCRSWILPVIGAVSYAAISQLSSFAFESGRLQAVVYNSIICCFAFIGQRRNEVHCRMEWLASRRVQQQAEELVDITQLSKAFSAMAGTTCDHVLMLTEDLCVSTDARSDAYFGRPVSGLPFVELLAEDDRGRFREMLKRAQASGEMESLPVMLLLAVGAVSSHVTALFTAARMRGPFLVGIRLETTEPLQERELRDDLLDNRPQDGLGRLPLRRSADLESLVSRATTSFTGHVFSDMERLAERAKDRSGAPSRDDDLRQTLLKVAELGAKEHWLVGTAEVELLPDKVLGSGGFSIVVPARVRGSPVAAKLPRVISQSDVSRVASLANEIRVHRHVRHSNIALFYGACVDPPTGQLALLFELVQGVRLDAFVYTQLSKFRGIQARIRRVQLLADIASALQYMHGLDPMVVHGDLKAANIMVEFRRDMPHAKLLDFGLARICTKQARPLGGTAQWMAPELKVRDGRPSPKPSADVYSFGFVHYFIFTSVVPREAVIAGASMEQAAAQPRTMLRWPAKTSAFPKEAQEACIRCLQLQPDARPTMDKVLASVLQLVPSNSEILGSIGLSMLMLLVAQWSSWDDGVRTVQGAKAHPASGRRPPAEDLGQEGQDGPSVCLSELALSCSAMSPDGANIVGL